MYKFFAKIARLVEPGAGTFYQTTSVQDQHEQPCGGVVDLKSKYKELAALTENLARQLGIRTENLVLVREIGRHSSSSDSS